MTLQSVIAQDNFIPGTYTRTSFGVGIRTNAAGSRYVVLFGNKLSTAPLPVNTEVDCYSEDDAKALAGAGSELHILAWAAIKAWPNVPLKLIAIAESAGAQASGTIVLTGPASSSGTIGVTCLGEEIEIPFFAGDTATAMATATAQAINGKTDWPITATSTTGTVTCTAKNRGTRGNLLALRGRIIAGSGVGITPPVSGKLTGGATSDDPQSALDAMAAVNRRYFVAPYSDATQLAKFRTHAQAEDEPEVGHRKRVICASTDTLANTTTLATGLNEPRVHVGWQKNADLPPGAIAAGFAARIAAQETNNVSFNFDGEIIPGQRPHASNADRPIPSELISALKSGITPLVSHDDGTVSICRAITSKSRDAQNNADWRVLDIAKVAVTDEAADRFEIRFADRFKAFNASQDPEDGELPAPNTTTPSMCRDLAFEITSEMEDQGHLESGSSEANKSLIFYELSKVSPGRFNGVIPLDVVEGAHQFAIDIRQVA